jgi:hypothetical protein
MPLGHTKVNRKNLQPLDRRWDTDVKAYANEENGAGIKKAGAAQPHPLLRRLVAEGGGTKDNEFMGSPDRAVSLVLAMECIIFQS